MKKRFCWPVSPVALTENIIAGVTGAVRELLMLTQEECNLDA